MHFFSIHVFAKLVVCISIDQFMVMVIDTTISSFILEIVRQKGNKWKAINKKRVRKKPSKARKFENQQVVFHHVP